MLARPLLSA